MNMISAALLRWHGGGVCRRRGDETSGKRSRAFPPLRRVFIPDRFLSPGARKQPPDAEHAETLRTSIPLLEPPSSIALAILLNATLNAGGPRVPSRLARPGAPPPRRQTTTTADADANDDDADANDADDDDDDGR